MILVIVIKCLTFNSPFLQFIERITVFRLFFVSVLKFGSVRPRSRYGNLSNDMEETKAKSFVNEFSCFDYVLVHQGVGSKKRGVVKGVCREQDS